MLEHCDVLELVDDWSDTPELLPVLLAQVITAHSCSQLMATDTPAAFEKRANMLIELAFAHVSFCFLVSLWCLFQVSDVHWAKA